MTKQISDGHLKAALDALSTFGVATIKTPKPRKVRARKYNCGAHGMLNVYQIAEVSGLTVNGVFNRIYAGFKREELCEPRHEKARAIKGGCQKPVMALAMKLARTFPDRVPSVREIRSAHPMCVRNAQRWRTAMNDAQAKGDLA